LRILEGATEPEARRPLESKSSRPAWATEWESWEENKKTTGSVQILSRQFSLQRRKDEASRVGFNVDSHFRKYPKSCIDVSVIIYFSTNHIVHCASWRCSRKQIKARLDVHRLQLGTGKSRKKPELIQL
jgi:hypothetical protein